MKSTNLVKPLHDLGLALIWLYPKSKRPIGTRWTEGPRMIWPILDKEFKNNNNCGVRLGEPSKFSDGTYLAVIDCDVKSRDPKHLKEMELALSKFCPSVDFAPRVLSGRGGGSCHCYVRTPTPQQSFKAIRSKSLVKVYMGSVPPSQVDLKSLSKEEVQQGFRMRLAWEIDVFGNGKQVVVPPSTHPDSLKEYVWEGEAPKSFEEIPLIENLTPVGVKDKGAGAGPKGSGIKISPEIKDMELLDAVNLSTEAYDLIVAGVGMGKFPSRSEALYSGLNSLARAGLKDAEILGVLTNPENFLSEKALEKGTRQAGAEWLAGQLAKVRADHRKSGAFEKEALIEDMDDVLALTPEEAEAHENEIIVKHWTDELLVSKSGEYRNTAHNVYLILKNLYKVLDKPPEPLLGYNIFQDKCIYLSVPPWGEEEDLNRAIEDVDSACVKIWLSKHWGIEVATNTVFETFSAIAREKTFHPIKDYLEGLIWDGVPRVDNMLHTYCGAEGPEKYIKAVSRKMMCAAVARIFKPGIKFDQVVIFEGTQGIGKSAFIKALVSPAWHTDVRIDVKNKDVVDTMAGKWVWELGELAGMRKADVNDLKSFLSQDADRVRKSYNRLTKEYPRHIIFIGTSNNSEYLKDETGGRRFWPIVTTDFKIEIEDDGVKAHRDQLWAEAVYLWNQGEKLWIEDEATRLLATHEQSTRRIVDEIESTIEDILSSPDFPHPFQLTDVWEKIVISGVSATRIKGDLNQLTQSRLTKALGLLGYETTVLRIDGKNKRVWTKKEVKKRKEGMRLKEVR